MVLEMLDTVWSTRTSAEVGVHRRLAIRRAVAVVRPKAMRMALDELLHLAAPGTDPEPEVLRALINYAEQLQYETEFRLAGHVYSMVIDYATQTKLFKLLPEAYEQHGTCMRQSGNTRAALASYATGLAIAARHRNSHGQFRIAIAQANLNSSIGKLEEARKALDAVLRRARRLADSEIIMRAAHERGNVAHKLGDYQGALDYFAEAFAHCTNPKHRGRLLNDIALTLKDLGFLSEARDAWLVSYLVTKGDSFAKWAAGINLLMLAHMRGDESAFDQFSRDLARAPMPARLLVAFNRELADGLARFDRPREASAAHNRAVALANRYGLMNMLQEAADPPATPCNLSGVAEDLLTKVRELRSLANLLGPAWSGDARAKPVASLRTALKRGRPRRSSV